MLCSTIKYRVSTLFFLARFLGRSSSAVRSALAWLADDELDDEVDMVV